MFSPVAVHEAGHALVALERGFALDGVRLLPDGAGVTYPGKGPCEEVAALTVLVAGQLAENKLWGRSDDGFNWIPKAGVDSDAQRCRVVLDVSERDLRGMRRAREYAEAVAGAILALRWDDVLAVAAQLERRRELSGEEVEAVLQGLKADPPSLRLVPSRGGGDV